MKNYLIQIITALSMLIVASPKQVSAQGITQKIKQVENSLMTTTQTEGVPPKTYTLAERMKFYQTPTVSIALINNDKIEWTKAYGVAGANNKQIANAETVFQLASYSKEITDFLTVRLADEGVLKLDANVNTYLKSWKLPESDRAKNHPVTVRSLIDGTSGINVSGFYGYDKGAPLPTTIQLLNGEKPANNEPIKVISEPGSIIRESGGGYMVLQQLLEDVAGKSYETLLQQKVFKPLGMLHSSSRQPAQANVTNGFWKKGEQIKGGWFVYPQLASSGTWSTPADLAKMVLEIQRALKGQSKIISKKAALQLISITGEKSGDQLFYCLTSSNHGYMTYAEGSMSSGRGIVISTNSNQGIYLMQEICNSIDKVYNWKEHLPNVKVKINPDQLKAFAGKYQMVNNKHAYMQISTEDDHLLAKHEWENVTDKMYAKSDHQFFGDTQGAPPLDFLKDNNGKVNKFIAFGTDDWIRVAEIPVTIELKAFEGKYQMNKNKQAFIQITATDDCLVAEQLWDGKEFKAFPKGDLKFVSAQGRLIAEFRKDDHGKINQFIAFGTDEWDRVERQQLTTAQLKCYEGKYEWQDNKQFIMQLTAKENYLEGKQLWDGKVYNAVPQSELLFTVENSGGQAAKFEKDNNGNISKFTVSGRVWIKIH
jgi:CubicO group peptidase (beta-lactamase class C family)